MRAFGVHRNMLCGRATLQAVTGFDLLLARVDDEYTFCRCSAVLLEKNVLRFGCELSHSWRGICCLSQSIMDKAYTRPSLPANFRHFSKWLQHLLERSVLFERRVQNRYGYLVSYCCVNVYFLIEFAQVSCYVPSPHKWAFIEVRMGYAALLPPIM